MKKHNKTLSLEDLTSHQQYSMIYYSKADSLYC